MKYLMLFVAFLAAASALKCEQNVGKYDFESRTFNEQMKPIVTQASVSIICQGEFEKEGARFQGKMNDFVFQNDYASPYDFEGFEFEFAQLSSGEIYGLKMVESYPADVKNLIRSAVEMFQTSTQTKSRSELVAAGKVNNHYQVESTVDGVTVQAHHTQSDFELVAAGSNLNLEHFGLSSSHLTRFNAEGHLVHSEITQEMSLYKKMDLTGSSSPLVGQSVEESTSLTLRSSAVEKPLAKHDFSSLEWDTVGLVHEIKGKHGLQEPSMDLNLGELRADIEKLENLLKKISSANNDGLIVINSDTTVWNDTSNDLYNLIAPASQRQADVDNYSDYGAYMLAEELGLDLANLKFALGVFGGAGASGCTGDIKTYNRLYLQTNVVREEKIIFDLILYVYTLYGEIDSRLYAEINDNVFLDVSLNLNCTPMEFSIFDDSIALLDYEESFPFANAELVIVGNFAIGLKVATEYEVCGLLSANPFIKLNFFVDAFTTFEFSLGLDSLFVRAGGVVDFDLQYRIGPEINLGATNSTTCEACIGVYHSNEDLKALFYGYYQLRDGVRWGPQEDFYLIEFREPAQPWRPLVEVCS